MCEPVQLPTALNVDCIQQYREKWREKARKFREKHKNEIREKQTRDIVVRIVNALEAHLSQHNIHVIGENVTMEDLVDSTMKALYEEVQPGIIMWEVLRSQISTTKPICIGMLWKVVRSMGIEISPVLFIDGCKIRKIYLDAVCDAIDKVKSGGYQNDSIKCNVPAADGADDGGLFDEVSARYEMDQKSKRNDAALPGRAPCWRVIFDDGSEEPKVMHLDPTKAGIVMQLISVL